MGERGGKKEEVGCQTFKLNDKPGRKRQGRNKSRRECGLAAPSRERGPRREKRKKEEGRKDELRGPAKARRWWTRGKGITKVAQEEKVRHGD